jgi:hypothetical protein
MATLDMLCTSISCLLRWVLETKPVVSKYCLASHQWVDSACCMSLSWKTQHLLTDAISAQVLHSGLYKVLHVMGTILVFNVCNDRKKRKEKNVAVRRSL